MQPLREQNKNESYAIAHAAIIGEGWNNIQVTTSRYLAKHSRLALIVAVVHALENELKSQN